ncbi:hypothetical protein Lfu02_59610 [Longispora fulva]|uniref:DUF3885 domain-containing protein n=1 Tax=Longispora fulva TaxID=619741 RepID=A0A8J7KWX7_9ACTN|nr:hypothetical protein [Longispora fulva]MBG6137057.1 hypothetical protein [Longispora fulva]GIG61589.1 hypothetical protein Lfu02_59610 [Longispora fulva]
MHLGPAEGPAIPAAGQGIDPTTLTDRWTELWPECAPVPTRLRAAYPDRWIRFRTLPEGRRHPASEEEYAAVLHRHNTVLDDLVTDGRVLVLTAAYSETLRADAAPHPGDTYWTSVLLTDERTGYEIHQHQYARLAPWSPGCLDPLLRTVATDLAATVLVADAELRWLCHPFAGGMDVILPTPEHRDALGARHPAWRSTRATGL